MSSFGYACYLFDTQKVACCLQFRSKGNWTIALRECWRPFSFLFLQLDCNIYANACLQFTKKLSLFARIYFLFSTIKQIELARANNDVVLRRTLCLVVERSGLFLRKPLHIQTKNLQNYRVNVAAKNEQRKVKEHWAIAEELWQSYKYKLPENMLNSKLQYFPKKPPLYSRRKLNKQEAF